MARQFVIRAEWLYLGFVALVVGAGSPAVSAPSLSESDARIVCREQAKSTRLKVPSGACDDPRSKFRISMLTAHRAQCARSSPSQQGVLKCARPTADDK